MTRLPSFFLSYPAITLRDRRNICCAYNVTMQLDADTRRFILGCIYLGATFLLIAMWCLAFEVIMTKFNAGIDGDLHLAWMYTYRIFLLPTLACLFLALRCLRSSEPFGLFKPADYRTPSN